MSGAGEKNKAKPSRPSIRDAFISTVQKCEINIRELHEKCGVQASAISRFQNNKREITTDTLHRILQALTDKEYRYFMSVLFSGSDVLSKHDSSLEDERLCDDPDLEYVVFRTMLNTFASECTNEQFEDMLYTMAEARRSTSQKREEARQAEVANVLEASALLLKKSGIITQQ